MTTEPIARPGASEAQIREALHELQRYLSDELAPMMVAESVELLFRAGPDATAAGIESWLGTQYGRPGTAAAVSDYLFHSVKKLHQMAEYDLIDRAAVAHHLEQLTPRLVGLCPEVERAVLVDNLARLDHSDTGVVAPAALLHRPSGTDAPAAPTDRQAPIGPARPLAPPPPPRTARAPEGPETVSAEVARGMRRFALLLDRLTAAAGRTSGEGGAPPLETQALVTAAETARDPEELARWVRRLESFSDGRLERVIEALSRDLPGWSVALPDGSGTVVPPSRSARAIGRILDLSDDPHQAIHHVNAMLQAAVERFNEGALGPAATMVELAHHGIRDKGIDPETFRELLRRTQETLSPDRLRECSDRADRHGALRRFLAAFPGYTVDGLLDALVVEPRRDRRRFLLGLLEAWGEAARLACLERLERYSAGEGDDLHGYHRRNFVYLMRRIPASGPDTFEREVRVLTDASRLVQPPLLVREALMALGSVLHADAERVLIERVNDIETALGSGDPPQSEEDLRGALDRLVPALIRHATPAALRTAVNHAFRKQAGLGDTLARVEDLAGHDLSIDPELVQHLLKVLERELPPKVLGLVVPRHADRALRVVRWFARTPLPAVREALSGIVDQYRGRDLADAAQAVLDGLDAPAPAPAAVEREAAASLTGDVELFGLPNLLQSLSDSKVSGVLTLTEPGGGAIGTVVLAAGRIASCSSRRLDGEAAFYQLFETPEPGTFAFRKGEPEADAPADDAATWDVQSSLLEGLRRYDELQQARAIVPDETCWKPTGRKPTAIEGEDDRELMREVWARASGGTAPGACERELGVDSYRVRRLYAHWVEGGALGPAGT